jgi:hypothetical protein
MFSHNHSNGMEMEFMRRLRLKKMFLVSLPAMKRTRDLEEVRAFFFQQGLENVLNMERGFIYLCTSYRSILAVMLLE